MKTLHCCFCFIFMSCIWFLVGGCCLNDKARKESDEVFHEPFVSVHVVEGETFLSSQGRKWTINEYQQWYVNCHLAKVADKRVRAFDNVPLSSLISVLKMLGEGGSGSIEVEMYSAPENGTQVSLIMDLTRIEKRKASVSVLKTTRRSECANGGIACIPEECN